MSTEKNRDQPLMQGFVMWNGYKVFPNGVIISRWGRRLKTHITPKGYEYAKFVVGEGKKYTSVHRVVAICFIPNPNNYPTVNHKDFNKVNNDVSNLEWATMAMQRQHTVKHGRHGKIGMCRKGTLNHMSRLSEEMILEIRRKRENGASVLELSAEYGVSSGHIYKIAKGASWHHLETQSISDLKEIANKFEEDNDG